MGQISTNLITGKMWRTHRIGTLQRVRDILLHGKRGNSRMKAHFIILLMRYAVYSFSCGLISQQVQLPKKQDKWQRRCPYCKSERINLHAMNRWYCTECGRTFKR